MTAPANTVTNEGAEVAGAKTVHTAKTDGYTDTCYIVKPKTGDFENACPSDRIKAGKSTNTNIKDGEIALLRTEWGPDSDPAHEGVQKGVDSGTYRAEAKATTASTTCYVEGDGVVRTDDPTTQNHANTEGKVEAGKYEPSNMSLAEFREKVCQIHWFKGIDTKTGRELGWPGKDKTGEAKYLEVFENSTVEFFTERHDITKTPPEVNPKCPAPDEDHTQWLASCKVFPLYAYDDKKDDKGTEHFTIDSSMALEEWLVTAMGMNKGDDEGAQDYGHEWGGERDMEHDARRNFNADRNAGGYNAPGGAQVAGSNANLILEAPNHDSHATARERYSQLKDAYGTDAEGNSQKYKKVKQSLGPLSAVSVKRILIYMWWAFNAPVINVSATSCGASRTAEIKVFPFRKLKIDLDLEWLNEKGRAARQSMGQGMHDRAQQRKRDAAREMRRETNRAGRAAGKAEYNEGRANRAHPNDKQQQSHFNNQAAKHRADEEKALARFDKAEKNFKQAVSAISTIKKVFAVGEKVARVAGEPLSIQFLEGFGLEIVIGYDVCEDKYSEIIRNKYYPQSKLGQTWEITLEAEPLIGVDYTVNFSLLNFILPFAGQGIGKLLRRAKVVRVDIFFGIAFGVSLGVQISKDQHDKIAGQFSASFDLNMSMGIAAGIAGIDAVRFTARFPAKAGVTIKGAGKDSPPGAMIVAEFSANISSHFTLVVLPDTWFEFEAWSASPKSLSYQTPPYEKVILQQSA